MKLGQILKETRIKRGTSLSEVAKELLIQEQYIEAIEDGMDEILPSGTYKRIYLRAYCKYLGIEFRDDINTDKTENQTEETEFQANDDIDQFMTSTDYDDNSETELYFDISRFFRILFKLASTAFVFYIIVKIFQFLFS